MVSDATGSRGRSGRGVVADLRLSGAVSAAGTWACSEGVTGAGRVSSWGLVHR